MEGKRWFENWLYISCEIWEHFLCIFCYFLVLAICLRKKATKLFLQSGNIVISWLKLQLSVNIVLTRLEHWVKYKNRIIHFYNYRKTYLKNDISQYLELLSYIPTEICVFVKTNLVFYSVSIYTQLRTMIKYLSNTHLFKGTKGHFYQFWKISFIFWVYNYKL